jgi:hypothetical protein
MRLPMKPSALPASTPTLPMVLASAIVVTMACGDVLPARTTSSSFITLAGLKKCAPITLSGRAVAEAIWSMSSVDVLVARIAPGFITASSWRNTACLMAMSSKAASTTMSASARSA